jgi:hypothetical protein
MAARLGVGALEESKASPPTLRIVAKDVLLVKPEEAWANISGPVITMYRKKRDLPDSELTTFDFYIFGSVNDLEKIIARQKR